RNFTMKLQVACVILILNPGVLAPSPPPPQSQDSPLPSAEIEPRSPDPVLSPQALLRRAKRHNAHFPICTYCCKCCRNQGCGFCCRT
uniref:Hepcidin n=1 Tax=Chelonoidis abingdonii TaxID=106734 RepID=A0A8C0GZ75_CHEAB